MNRVNQPFSNPAENVGRINLAPHIPTLDGTHLNWLTEQYIADCRTRLEHQYTTDGYEYQLRWFTGWWAKEGPNQQWLLRPSDLIRFEKYLRAAISSRTKKALSYNTRNTILKRLRECLKWAQENGFLDRSYTTWVPKADGAPPKRKAAPITSLQQLLEIAARGSDPTRDKCVIAMLLGMGLRRSELSNLDIGDVVIYADHSGYASVVGKKTKANATGERDAAFDSATGKIITAYLDKCGRTTGPLITGQRGLRVRGQGIYRIVKKAIAKAHLESQLVGPHDLRRAFATFYRRQRKDKSSADLLRRQLGHASLSQTDEYTLLEVEDIREDLVSPIAIIDGIWSTG